MAERHDFVLTSASLRKNLCFSVIAGLSRTLVEAEKSVFISHLGVHFRSRAISHLLSASL
jgi:hypothetical protein